MKALTSEQLAYIAGLFDGEGTLVIGKYPVKTQVNWAYRGFFAIANTHVPTLQYVKSLIGGKIVEQGIGKKCFSLTLSTNEVRNILPELLPYFSIKKEQAEVMLKFIEKQASRNFGLISQEQLDFCEECYIKIKALKQKRYEFKEFKGIVGERKCSQCPTVFVLKNTNPNKKYCSVWCRKERRWTYYNKIVRDRKKEILN